MPLTGSCPVGSTQVCFLWDGIEGFFFCFVWNYSKKVYLDLLSNESTNVFGKGMNCEYLQVKITSNGVFILRIKNLFICLSLLLICVWYSLDILRDDDLSSTRIIFPLVSDHSLSGCCEFLTQAIFHSKLVPKSLATIANPFFYTVARPFQPLQHVNPLLF